MFYRNNKLAYWPRGDVPYIIRNYPNPELIRSAMDYIEDVTGNLIQFIPNTSPKTVRTYLVFYKSEIQNFAHNTGRVIGENRVDLRVDNKRPKRTVIHEICHALGIGHEHQSPNRDQFVKINFHNIKASHASKFSILTSDFVFEEPYDFESISHYDAYAGSTASNRKTIGIVHAKDFHFDNVMGKKETISDSDLKAIKKMYALQ